LKSNKEKAIFRSPVNLKIRSDISSLSSEYSLKKGVIISPIIKDINIWNKNKKYETLFFSEIEKME